MCTITTRYVTIAVFIIFSVWRHIGTVCLIVKFYNESELRSVIDTYRHFDRCRQQESMYRTPITMMIKSLFYNNRVVDDLLALQFCLNKGYIRSDNIFNSDIVLPIQTTSSSIFKFLDVPIVRPRAILSYVCDFSRTLQLLSSGHYVVNIMDGMHMDMMTNVNKLILSTKNRQNEAEYLIKQLISEVSYLYRILVNYLYFSISYTGVFITALRYMSDCPIFLQNNVIGIIKILSLGT